jgi:hypothetical protein
MSILYVHLGYSDFEPFKCQTVWEQKMNSKNILEMAFFYNLSGFFLKGTVARGFRPRFFVMNRTH